MQQKVTLNTLTLESLNNKTTKLYAEYTYSGVIKQLKVTLTTLTVETLNNRKLH